VRHGRITKHPDNVQQRVRIAKRRDVEQRSGTCAHATCPAHVGELHSGGHVLLRLEEVCQPVEPFVRDAGHPDIRLLFAGGPGRLARAGQQLEEGGLPGSGKPNEACSEHVGSAHPSMQTQAKI